MLAEDPQVPEVAKQLEVSEAIYHHWWPAVHLRVPAEISLPALAYLPRCNKALIGIPFNM